MVRRFQGANRGAVRGNSSHLPGAAGWMRTTVPAEITPAVFRKTRGPWREVLLRPKAKEAKFRPRISDLVMKRPLGFELDYPAAD